MQRGNFWGALTLSLLAGAALAQGAPPLKTPAPLPSASAPDPALLAAQQAFDTMPLAARVALQDNLVWTGDFQSVTSGTFGKRTYDAILAYAKRAGLPADGTLDAKAQAGLAAAGDAARKAAGFAPVEETKAGLRIGVPVKLLGKATPTPTGQRYAAPDNTAVLETFALSGPENDLAAQFEKLKADGPGRKVSYKLLRPDFFVVTGEAGSNSFYTRVAAAMQGGVPVLKGYTFSYAAARKAALDKVTIAIANSFEPSGLPGKLVGGNPSTASVAPPQAGTVPAAKPPTVQPAAKSSQLLTGLVINASEVMFVMPPSGCAVPMVGKTAAKVLATSKLNGATILEWHGTPLTKLSFSTDPTGEVVVLAFDGSGQLSAVVGETLKQSPPRLRAALGVGASGGVAFDRVGAFVGLAVPESPGRTTPPGSYGFVVAEPGTGAAGPTLSVGEIVAGAKGAVVAVTCGG